MGNEFYFLPTGSCLRRDGKCTKANSTNSDAVALAGRFESAYWPKVIHDIDIQLTHQEIKLARDIIRAHAGLEPIDDGAKYRG